MEQNTPTMPKCIRFFVKCWNISKNIFCDIYRYIYKLHNSYFVNFLNLAFFVFLYLYTLHVQVSYTCRSLTRLQNSEPTNNRLWLRNNPFGYSHNGAQPSSIVAQQPSLGIAQDYDAIDNASVMLASRKGAKPSRSATKDGCASVCDNSRLLSNQLLLPLVELI